MNNTTTKRNLALAAVFIAATLVVGTFAVTTTTIATTGQSAYAYSQKKGADKKDGNGNDNGNTITIQKCKQAAIQSGFDNNQGQECENLICTHPGNNATCVQEGVTSTATPTPTTIQVGGQGEGENFCPNAEVSLPASITFSAQQSGSVAVQGQFTVTVDLSSGEPIIKTGTLNDLQISGNTFTLTGTELSQGPARCGGTNLPVSATITGQCGTGVTIQYTTADGEHATFTGNVVCTTT
jgi:hypothetical protein